MARACEGGSSRRTHAARLPLVRLTLATGPLLGAIRL